jgi:hypothetical protein
MRSDGMDATGTVAIYLERRIEVSSLRCLWAIHFVEHEPNGLTNNALTGMPKLYKALTLTLRGGRSKNCGQGLSPSKTLRSAVFSCRYWSLAFRGLNETDRLYPPSFSQNDRHVY